MDDTDILRITPMWPEQPVDGAHVIATLPVAGRFMGFDDAGRLVFHVMPSAKSAPEIFWGSLTS